MNDIEKQILENELALALDAAEKGDKARLECGAMEMEIKHLKEHNEKLVEEATSLLETFVVIADYLGIDCKAAQKLPGKPSQVFIDAINKREESIRAEITRLESEAVYGAAAFQAAKDEIKRLKSECVRLRNKLLEASECISEWGAYADKYFQEKHHLERDIAEFKEAAMQENKQ